MIGQVYGSYRVTGKLGEGGMGVVYEAEHVHMGRKVAVKILLPKWTNNKLVVERFFNEARSSALANHQGIVKIFDCGFAQDGNAYLVMELLHGEPLAALLAREGRLPVHRMTSLSRQLAGALAAAHHKGIVHRDLKPDNIFVIPDRDAQTGESVKVLDFGIAKLASSRLEHTVAGVMLGTPLYMSPEQCVSSAEVDGRSDIYSLGCIMFEMLCGRPPFVHDEPSVLAMMQVNDAPPRPSSLQEGIPINVESLIVRTLAKDRGARPQSMDDLRAELDVVWSLLPSVERPSHRALPGAGMATPRALPAPTLGLAEAPPARFVGVDPGMGGALVSPARPARPRARSWVVRLVTSLVILAVVAGAGAAIFALDLFGAQPAVESDPADRVVFSISSEPPGATVYLDGARVGVTPLETAQPRGSGSVWLRLELDGYRAETRAISARQGGAITAVLIPEGRADP